LDVYSPDVLYLETIANYGSGKINKRFILLVTSYSLWIF
jgi:hypothetical protein